MSVLNVAKETISIWEALRACTFTNTDHTMLLRMQNSSLERPENRWNDTMYQDFNCIRRMVMNIQEPDLFAHGLRIGDSSTEETIPLQAAIQPCPMVVPISSMGQAPGNKGVELAVHRITSTALSTLTHPPQCTTGWSSILLVLVGVTAENKEVLVSLRENLASSVRWRVLTAF